MTQNKNRIVALSTIAAMTLTTFGAALTPAEAISTSAKKKIAIGGAAVGAYGLLTGKKKTAIIGGAVGAGSYLWYRQSKKKEELRRQAYYRQRYGRNWRNHYKPGS
jgi:hypothetical protein